MGLGKLKLSRITSYNVCYTKLLRIPKEIDFNNTSLLPYGKVDNELYFKSCIEDQNIYFSISFDRLIPGITKISNFETFSYNFV